VSTLSAWTSTWLQHTKRVVLKLGSEDRIRFPGTLCAALSNLSIKPLIICVTDFVLLKNKTCELNCLKISLVRLSNEVVTLDLAAFSEKVEKLCSKPLMFINTTWKWLKREPKDDSHRNNGAAECFPREEEQYQLQTVFQLVSVIVSEIQYIRHQRSRQSILYQQNESNLNCRSNQMHGSNSISNAQCCNSTRISENARHRHKGSLTRWSNADDHAPVLPVTKLLLTPLTATAYHLREGGSHDRCYQAGDLSSRRANRKLHVLPGNRCHGLDAGKRLIIDRVASCSELFVAELADVVGRRHVLRFDDQHGLLQKVRVSSAVTGGLSQGGGT